MSTLDHDFIQQLAALGSPYPRLKWYIGAIVALSALNYPEEIGPLYICLLNKYIAPDDHYEQTRKIKEALVKACGLHGAAKVFLFLLSVSNAEFLTDPYRPAMQCELYMP
jgi:hypothetical protein